VVKHASAATEILAVAVKEHVSRVIMLSSLTKHTFQLQPESFNHKWRVINVALLPFKTTIF